MNGPPAKCRSRRGDEQILAGDQNGVRGADAGGFERGVLAGLADLEVERAAAVDDAAPVPIEPGQHRRGQLGGVAMVAGVRRGAHPVVEHALGRRLRQVEDAAVEKPVAPRQPLPSSALANGSSQAAFSWITWMWVTAASRCGRRLVTHKLLCQST